MFSFVLVSVPPCAKLSAATALDFAVEEDDAADAELVAAFYSDKAALTSDDAADSSLAAAAFSLSFAACSES